MSCSKQEVQSQPKMAIAPGYAISEASKEEMAEVFQVLVEAFAKDPVWIQVFKNCKQEEIHPWLMANMCPRWTMPDIKTFKVTEVSTGKIVAWAALNYPWKYIPDMDAEQKSRALSKDLPPALEGMNMEALGDFFTSLSNSKNHGYNPEEEYHRKGTMVHPDYQMKGFGTELTKHCNAISDESRNRTWASARPTSVKMVRNHGFKNIGFVDARLERWGCPRENSITWTLLRDPASS